jgi:hypothetical protein
VLDDSNHSIEDSLSESDRIHWRRIVHQLESTAEAGIEPDIDTLSPSFNLDRLVIDGVYESGTIRLNYNSHDVIVNPSVAVGASQQFAPMLFGPSEDVSRSRLIFLKLLHKDE